MDTISKRTRPHKNSQQASLLAVFHFHGVDTAFDLQYSKTKHMKDKVRKMVIRQFEASDIDYVISRHLDLYKAEYGFTSEIWKAYVADGVRQLAAGFDPERDCFYILESCGSPSGCIAIVHREGGSAQLRFFFVEPSLRGQGAGNSLMNAAISFSREKKYARVFLWTFSELHTARHLYGKHGFLLTETLENTEWGEPVLEERWDLHLL
ncbi:MAG: GNAT family N-acetyltransferase [Clostridiales bacterium]|nr:GNAT family N-acetyltransferase [Clostridiales bacterium]